MPYKSFLTWPFFEGRHRLLAAAIDDWCKSHLPVVHCDVDTACRELVAKLGRDGWLKHSAIDPDEAQPLDVRALCLMRETLARHDGLADFAFAMQGLGTGAISLFGTAAQREWLKQTRAGTAIAAFALTEPRSGSDVANIETTARRDGSDYILEGEKTWISNGGIADLYVVFARTGEGPGAKGISAFVVSADLVGLSIAERIAVIAPHPLARIRLEEARVPASAMIGAPGKGFKIAMATLDVFRTTVGAAALGFARRRSTRRPSGHASVDCSARRCPTCRWCKRTLPTWRSTSTRQRCSSTAPPGPRTMGQSASAARRQWPSCSPPTARRT
jgi:acyl-CoA dehydrogenase